MSGAVNSISSEFLIQTIRIRDRFSFPLCYRFRVSSNGLRCPPIRSVIALAGEDVDVSKKLAAMRVLWHLIETRFVVKQTRSPFLAEPVPFIRDQKEIMAALYLRSSSLRHTFQSVARFNWILIIQLVPCLVRSAIRAGLRIILLILLSRFQLNPEHFCVLKIKKRFLMNVVAAPPVLRFGRATKNEA